MSLVARSGVARIEQAITPQCIKIRSRPTLEGRTPDSEPTTGKLVDDYEVTASPCHVGDSRYNTIYSLDPYTLHFHPNPCLAQP